MPRQLPVACIVRTDLLCSCDRLATAGLRSREAQSLLSRLAACPCISLLASFEHVNTPLLWDATCLAAFNWLHFDVTSYQPYTAETAGLPSLLVNARYLEMTRMLVLLLMPGASVSLIHYAQAG